MRLIEKNFKALVHDPNKTSDVPKIKLDGIPINVCDNLQDYDQLKGRVIQECIAFCFVNCWDWLKPYSLI